MARMPNDPVQAVRTIVRLAKRVQEDGRECLIEEAQHADNTMLRAGLQLIAQGADEAELKAILGRQITEATANLDMNSPTRQLVETGLLSINAGEDPEAIRQKLEALLTPEEQSRLPGATR